MLIFIGFKKFIILFYSIHWTHTDKAQYSKNFVSYFPSWPYIIDPANPFNNVYKSGISRYKANSPEGTYEPGDGNWSNFVRYIDSLDLSLKL